MTLFGMPLQILDNNVLRLSGGDLGGPARSARRPLDRPVTASAPSLLPLNSHPVDRDGVLVAIELDGALLEPLQTVVDARQTALQADPPG